MEHTETVHTWKEGGTRQLCIRIKILQPQPTPASNPEILLQKINRKAGSWAASQVMSLIKKLSNRDAAQVIHPRIMLTRIKWCFPRVGGIIQSERLPCWHFLGIPGGLKSPQEIIYFESEDKCFRYFINFFPWPEKKGNCSNPKCTLVCLWSSTLSMHTHYEQTPNLPENGPWEIHIWCSKVMVSHETQVYPR